MDNQQAQNSCTCGKAGCMCGHHNGHSCLMKWLFRAAMILVVFWLGFMAGELHGMLRSYGHEGTRAGYMMRASNTGMMQGYDASGAPVTQ